MLRRRLVYLEDKETWSAAGRVLLPGECFVNYNCNQVETV